MALALNDVLEARAICNAQNQIAANIWHMQVVSVGGGGATEGEVASRLSTLLAGPYKGVLSSNAAFRGFGVKKIRPLPPGPEGTDVSLAGAGLVLGDMLPKQTSGIISLFTDTPGRRGRGRGYIPFPSEASNEADSTPTPAYFTALMNICITLQLVIVVTSILIPGGTLSLRFGVFSKTFDLFSKVVTAVCKDAWATQRRRGDFGRSNALPF